MKDVKVLGTGCSKCRGTIKLIEEVATSHAIPIHLEKIEDIQEIMSYKVMSTPAVVIDGKLVHAGGMPSQGKVESWFMT